MKHIYTTKKQKGFALLFAVLISSIIISIAATIISISIRQTVLSTTARESQFAFYAANTGLECAFYWDNVSTGLERVFPVGVAESPVDNTGIIRCAGGNITNGTGFTNSFAAGRSWTQVGVETNSSTTTFRMVIVDTSTSGNTELVAGETCALVTVNKTLAGSGSVTTRIESKGYNTCDITSPRAVERGLELEYQN